MLVSPVRAIRKTVIGHGSIPFNTPLRGTRKDTEKSGKLDIAVAYPPVGEAGHALRGLSM